MHFVVFRFFFKIIFFEKYFQEYHQSNILDPDQAQLFVGPDLGPNCIQRLSSDDTSKPGVNALMMLLVCVQGIFCPSLGAEFRPIPNRKKPPLCQNYVRFSQIKKRFCFFVFYFFFRDHYEKQWILKHLCLSGMLGIIQSKIT